MTENQESRQTSKCRLYRPRFNLVSLFLFSTLITLLVGWYAERSNWNSAEEWIHNEPGYTTTLTLWRNGNFLKTETLDYKSLHLKPELIPLVKPAEELDRSEKPRITMKFLGNYRRIEDGQCVFTVTKADADQSKIAEHYQNWSVGWEGAFQSSRDDFGNLLFVSRRWRKSGHAYRGDLQSREFMHWENYWKKVP